jgi:hypothetical protein
VNPNTTNSILHAALFCNFAIFINTIDTVTVQICEVGKIIFECREGYISAEYAHFINTHVGVQIQSLQISAQEIIQYVLGGLKSCTVHTKNFLNTLRTGDADLRFYITTVQDG